MANTGPSSIYSPSVMSRRSSKLLPWLVLAVGLVATYLLQQAAHNSAYQVQQDNFNYQTREITTHIQQRLTSYEQFLLGVQGLYISSSKVDRDEFRKYVTNLSLGSNFPGIQVVGFSLIIQPQEKARHIEGIRKEGFQDYSLRTGGEHAFHVPTIYLEPMSDHNLHDFGYDMYAEEVHREAMEQARDLNQTIITGRVKLTEESGQHAQSGFLMFVPVYRTGYAHETLADRRANIIGWVYSRIRMSDLILSILGEHVRGIDYEFFDGEFATPETLMYDYDGDFALQQADHSLFHSSQHIEVSGHTWTIGLHSLANFEADIDTGKVKVIWLAGISMSVLLSMLVWQLASGRAHALKLAQDMTRELRESEDKLRGLYELSPLGIALTDMKGRYIEFNQAFRKICGYSEDELKSLDYRMLTPRKYAVDDAQQLESLQRTGHYGPYEKEYIRKDGSLVPLQLSGLLISGPSGQKYIWSIVEDITERKRAEQQLHIAATAFETQEGILITDTKGTILRVNRGFCNITGYNAEDVIGRDPGILISDRHETGFYAEMWSNIQRTGSWDGEIWNQRKNGEIYPEHLAITAVKDPNGTIINYVVTLTDIIMSREAADEIKHLAFYDPLTRLPNRRLLMDRLQQALASSGRSGLEGALLFLDLDNFKTLNDTLGHAIGDLLLQQVAQRLTSCVREGDTVARLGGDEFVVLLERLSRHALSAAAQTKEVGEKILAALNQRYQLGSYECHSTSSIGVTLFSDHERGIDDLFKQADIAMYQAKKSGRNTLCFFDPAMQDSINARAALEADLHRAVENRQFQLYYQIQVDSEHRSVGAEALIRWIHPERGMILPALFIPLAEETGMIMPIGLWVLETACAQLEAWQRDVLARDLVLAVNVSAKQFRQPDFVAQVRAAMQRHAITPKLLKLELTESILVDDIEDTFTTMSALNEIGVQFSLDDFGTGYSSLQYLKNLSLDQLKIDQSFVRDIAVDDSDKAIVRTVIAMAKSLNLNVIAEGVETGEQRQLLLEKGCTHYQGYLFGRPVPIEEFDAVLKASRSADVPHA